ncbi:hypothetical protein MASR1M101_29710 [Gemmatimonas sp.]
MQREFPGGWGFRHAGAEQGVATPLVECAPRFLCAALRQIETAVDIRREQLAQRIEQTPVIGLQGATVIGGDRGLRLGSAGPLEEHDKTGMRLGEGLLYRGIGKPPVPLYCPPG